MKNSKKITRAKVYLCAKVTSRAKVSLCACLTPIQARYNFKLKLMDNRVKLKHWKLFLLVSITFSKLSF